jgi:hypothetical protein
VRGAIYCARRLLTEHPFHIFFTLLFSSLILFSSMPESIAVRCPSCTQEFPLSDAVMGSVRNGVEKELRADVERREKVLGEKLKALGEQQEALARKSAEQQEQVETQVKQRLARVTEEIKTKAARQATEAQEAAMKELQAELSDKAGALRKAQEQELELRREKRQLEEAKEALKLEVQRTLDAERGKLKEQLQAAANEENRLKIAEKEKVITDLMVKLEEAQRKAAQGSQQTQGEVLELDFEQQLRQAFPIDAINEISKGVRGADVLQEVRSALGRPCGLILYELKRTQNWSDGWVVKLKEDMRAAKAEIGVIVTEVLPKGFARFGQQDGVFMCDIASAIPLAHTLRRMVQELAIARGHQVGAQEKMQLLYAYLTGVEFRQRVSAVIEAFALLRADLEKERRGMTRAWAKREKHINAVVENMAGMIGDVQAISGNALQDIPALELDTEEEEDEEG